MPPELALLADPEAPFALAAERGFVTGDRLDVFVVADPMTRWQRAFDDDANRHGTPAIVEI